MVLDRKTERKRVSTPPTALTSAVRKPNLKRYPTERPTSRAL